MDETLEYKEVIETRTELEKTLREGWDEIIADVGSSNRISTTIDDKSLLLLIDPQIRGKNFNFGDNHISEKGLALALSIEAVNLQDILQGKVDRVQIIAPDPDDVVKMVEDTRSFIRKGGRMVLIMDIISNKKNEVDQKLDEIINSLGDETSYKLFDSETDEVDISELVEGEINSYFISNKAKVLLVRF